MWNRLQPVGFEFVQDKPHRLKPVPLQPLTLIYLAGLSSAYNCPTNLSAILSPFGAAGGTLASNAAVGCAAITSSEDFPCIISFATWSLTPMTISRCAITAFRSTVAP